MVDLIALLPSGVCSAFAAPFPVPQPRAPAAGVATLHPLPETCAADQLGPCC